MQHVEEAGIHSGDSACVLPPHSLGPEMLDEIRATTRAIALALGTLGLINIQYAVHNGELYIIEANPRASRTVPFVSKAIGVALAKMACRIMLGERLEDLGLPSEAMPTGHVCVKEAVLPFDRFAGSDALLGPEMRSTGEVMGIARDFPTAFAKAQAAAGAKLPDGGTVFISVTDADKAAASGIAALLGDLGFRVVATAGTARAIRGMGVRVDEVLEKIGGGRAERHRPHRRRRGRPRHQHADRLGRARRRLGDPPRRGRARDPLHHDAIGRPRGRARDRRRPPWRADGAVAAGDPSQRSQVVHE